MTEEDHTSLDRQGTHGENHWDKRYRDNDDTVLSWSEGSESLSFKWIVGAVSKTSLVVDIGAGRSLLLPTLLSAGYKHLTHVDWAKSASLSLQNSLSSQSSNIDWFIGDLMRWQAKTPVDLWHDRAVFHFQTDDTLIGNYLKSVHQNVEENGYILLATFHLDGPETCSGLPVMRYDESSLIATLQSFDGSNWVALNSTVWTHTTPAGRDQKFQYLLAQRR